MQIKWRNPAEICLTAACVGISCGDKLIYLPQVYTFPLLKQAVNCFPQVTSYTFPLLGEFDLILLGD